jgi:hypothetical protein
MVLASRGLLTASVPHAEQRRGRGAEFLLVGLLLLLAAGCVPKYQPVVLDTSRPIRVAFVFDHEEKPGVEGVPEDFAAGLLEVLTDRNLEPKRVATDDLSGAFERRRATAQRMEWLVDQGRGDELVLLVETRASFYSQISGRWRWTVSAKTTLSTGEGSFPLDETMEVPVFLEFGHENEPDAVDEAVGVVARRLGRLVDTALRVDDQASTSGSVDPDEWGPVYFVMVDRFANGDAANDGDHSDPFDPQAFHGGDLRGVIDHVDDIAAQGFRTVWLSPVFTMRTEPLDEWGAYHGYWLADPWTIEPTFGTEADLRELSDALHARGLKLVLDFVANHVGYSAPVTVEHPDWFHGHGPIEDWHDPVQTTDWDVHGLPDLAQENEEVYAWLLGAALRWIDVADIDGYRLDAVRHVPGSFWTRFNTDLRAAAGEDFLLIGELFEGNPAVVAQTWRDGAFGQMFDFPLHWAALDALCGEASFGRVASILYADRQYDDVSQLVTFADNHDLPRVWSACDGDVWKVQQVLAFLTTSRGRTMVTWGTSAALDGAHEPHNRGDMVFEPHPELGPRLTDLLRAPDVPARDTVTRILSFHDDGIEYVREGSDGTFHGKVLRTSDGVTSEFGHWAGPVPPLAGPQQVEVALTGAPVEAGDALVMVGAGPELGDWDPVKGVQLAGEGTAVGSLELPDGAVLEYKFVVRRPDGAVVWEQRPNRYAHVTGETLRISAAWSS